MEKLAVLGAVAFLDISPNDFHSTRKQRNDDETNTDSEYTHNASDTSSLIGNDKLDCFFLSKNDTNTYTKAWS